MRCSSAVEAEGLGGPRRRRPALSTSVASCAACLQVTTMTGMVASSTRICSSRRRPASPFICGSSTMRSGRAPDQPTCLSSCRQSSVDDQSDGGEGPRPHHPAVVAVARRRYHPSMRTAADTTRLQSVRQEPIDDGRWTVPVLLDPSRCRLLGSSSLCAGVTFSAAECEAAPT